MNDGCLIKYNGLTNNVLKPFIIHGNNFSRPDAFDTIALSITVIAGAIIYNEKWVKLFENENT